MLNERESKLVDIIRVNLRGEIIFSDEYALLLDIMRRDFEDYLLCGEVTIKGLKLWQEASARL